MAEINSTSGVIEVNSTKANCIIMKELESVVNVLLMVVGVLLIVIGLFVIREMVAFIGWLSNRCCTSSKGRKKRSQRTKKVRNIERLSFKNRCFLDGIPSAKDLNDRIVNLKIDLTTDDETLAGNGEAVTSDGTLRSARRAPPLPKFANMQTIPLY